MKFQPIKINSAGLRIGLIAGILTISGGPIAQAALDLFPGDSASYAVLYEGSGGHNLQINSSPLNGSTILGNVGLAIENAGNPQLQLNNPAVINGDINFAHATANFNNSGGVVNGSVNSGVSDVELLMDQINSLSQNLGALPGATLGISGTQTIDASSGTFDSTYDAYVFNLTSLNFGNGSTLTIDGQGLDKNVVINVDVANISGPHFAGAIQLAGGLTANNVFINLTGGNYTSLTGGPTLQTAANHAEQDVTYLNPTGVIGVNSVAIEGHLFGGDSAGMTINSGGTVQIVPEPGTMALAALGGLSMIVLRLRFSGKPQKII
jgi:hypothetical protein